MIEMNAEEARRLSNQNGRQEAIAKAIKEVEQGIEEACKQGKNYTHFGMKPEYGGKRIRINGRSEECPEIRKHFLRQGFRFKDTGYIQGVYQHTERITW